MGDSVKQLYDQGLYLSPDQQDLLLAALHSNTPANKQSNYTPRIKSSHSPDETSPNNFSGPPSGGHGDPRSNLNALGGFEDESPFLDFDPNVDFDFSGSADLIGDLPGVSPDQDYDTGEKRKSIDGKAEGEVEETGKKRRESEAKKPGRKPLTSEPTTVCILYHHPTMSSKDLSDLICQIEAKGSESCRAAGFPRT